MENISLILLVLKKFNYITNNNNNNNNNNNKLNYRYDFVDTQSKLFYRSGMVGYNKNNYNKLFFSNTFSDLLNIQNLYIKRIVHLLQDKNNIITSNYADNLMVLINSKSLNYNIFINQ